MRRTPPIVFLASLSALASAAAVAVWVGSYFAPALLARDSAGTDPPTVWREVGLYCGRGRIALFLLRLDYPKLNAPEYEAWSSLNRQYPQPTGWRRVRQKGYQPPSDFLGFGFRRAKERIVSRYPNGSRLVIRSSRNELAVPLWAVVLASGASALWAWRRHRRHGRERRLKEGRCLQCGYDLRATRGRCPECGLEPGPVSKLPEL